MQVKAIKLDQGWFIKDLPGFEGIKADVIDIEVDLTSNQLQQLDYKEVKGIAIMERYFEKRQREIQQIENTTELQAKFRQQFGISPRCFADIIREL